MALAVSVLDDVDLAIGDAGVTLPDPKPVLVPWRRVRQALGTAAPDSDLARLRLAEWLLAARWGSGRAAAELAAHARPVGFPIDAALHPGLDWVRERVAGGALDLGLGFLGADPRLPDRVVAAPQGVLDVLGVTGDVWWGRARGYVEDMGALAAARWWREPEGPLRPMGDCDVVTLLGSLRLRVTLTASSGGMRTTAVNARPGLARPAPRRPRVRAGGGRGDPGRPARVHPAAAPDRGRGGDGAGRGAHRGRRAARPRPGRRGA
ncbi:MAG TPA: hypothetical protein VKP64_15920, partial [Mycobacteriales bacterium]|nr:hypothetical protein [Mycobacteriales bacterium]